MIVDEPTFCAVKFAARPFWKKMEKAIRKVDASKNPPLRLIQVPTVAI